MCGRYTLKAPRDAIAEAFDLADVPQLLPRYNIAPTQPVPVVRPDQPSGGRGLSLLRWGLIPSWADDPAIGNRLINARAEPWPRNRPSAPHSRSVAASSSPTGSMSGSERTGKPPITSGSRTEPLRVRRALGAWEKSEEPVESCTLLTCEANGVVAPVHGRMPVILKPEDYTRWLDPEEQRRTEALMQLLAPLPDDWLSAQAVGKLVNNPRNEDRDASSRWREPPPAGF